jgi:ATP-binding cassette subfamily G (WHITE) protein 2 (SNQ2)
MSYNLRKTRSGVQSSERSQTDSDSHVNVQDAELIFETLSQQLSGTISLREKSRSHEAPSALEVNESGRFDLEGYLRNEKQSQIEEGHHDKHVNVEWDITVQGTKDSHRQQPTFGDAVIGLFGILPAIKAITGRESRETTETFDILSGMKGIAKSGEMVLVLGRPGSGCSTFLKVIANQRAGFTGVAGDVFYNGIPSQEFKERYGGEAVYNQEDDVFLPTLTVKDVSQISLLRSSLMLTPDPTDFELRARYEDAREASRRADQNCIQGKGHWYAVADV